MREDAGVLLALWAHMPTDFEGSLAATRTQLGDKTFGAAWAERRAMTLDHAVEYAPEEQREPAHR